MSKLLQSQFYLHLSSVELKCLPTFEMHLAYGSYLLGEQDILCFGCFCCLGILSLLDNSRIRFSSLDLTSLYFLMMLMPC